jgi:hypothetical protein
MPVEGKEQIEMNPISAPTGPDRGRAADPSTNALTHTVELHVRFPFFLGEPQQYAGRSGFWRRELPQAGFKQAYEATRSMKTYESEGSENSAVCIDSRCSLYVIDSKTKSPIDWDKVLTLIVLTFKGQKTQNNQHAENNLNKSRNFAALGEDRNKIYKSEHRLGFPMSEFS